MKQEKEITQYESTLIRNAFRAYGIVLKGLKEVRLQDFANAIRHRFGTTDEVVKDTWNALRKHGSEIAVLE